MTKKVVTSTKKIWLCTKCNSDNVVVKRWVNPNTKEIGDSCSDDEDEDCYCNDCEEHNEDEDCYCNDCEEHNELEIVELPIDAHIIGYQVDGDGVMNAGEIHPQMLNSSCVYSLSQAHDMYDGDNDDDSVWALSAIWSGDIKEPRIMFSHGVRD